MADDVKARMIRETARALARDGLQRASFSRILDSAQAPRGSLYHHFPGGKAELVEKAVQAAGDYALAALQRLEGRPADEVAAGFIELWRQILRASDFGAGCAVLAVTVATEETALTAAAAAVFAAWRNRLAEALANGGTPAPVAAGLAATLIAACEGAVALARAERSLGVFELVAAELIGWVRASQARA